MEKKTLKLISDVQRRLNELNAGVEIVEMNYNIAAKEWSLGFLNPDKSENDNEQLKFSDFTITLPDQMELTADNISFFILGCIQGID